MDGIKGPEGVQYPELNRELLVKVVDHALSAQNWDQATWYSHDADTLCGTSMCIAGFTAIDFAGWKPVIHQGGADYCQKDGELRFISGVASDELGLTGREAGCLFHSTSAEEVRGITEAILDGKYRE